MNIFCSGEISFGWKYKIIYNIIFFFVFFFSFSYAYKKKRTISFKMKYFLSCSDTFREPEENDPFKPFAFIHFITIFVLQPYEFKYIFLVFRQSKGKHTYTTSIHISISAYWTSFPFQRNGIPQQAFLKYGSYMLNAHINLENNMSYKFSQF